MIYQGGKRKIAKPIINILQQCIDKNKIKTYYEPFVGGANIIDKIKCERKIGNDNHKELIALLKAVQSGWKMPEYITEEEYNLVKNNQGLFTDNYVGLVGFCGSFAAKYFEGYNVYNDPQRTINGKRNPIMEAINELRNQDLSGIEFTNKNYLDVDTSQIKNWLVFCDPPNARSAKYAINKFDSKIFWDWARELSQNNFVFVSEYEAGLGFMPIWATRTRYNYQALDKFYTRKIRIEKLFVHEWSDENEDN